MIDPEIYSSPYADLPVDQWLAKTTELVQLHPFDAEEVTSIVMDSWDAIFQSTLGKKGYRIGRDIFPRPQVIGFLLQELITLELVDRYPEQWRGEISSSDKDLVYIPDDSYSVEVKSSSQGRIYGNRSYAQKGASSKKKKSGYYLAVNYGKFDHSKRNLGSQTPIVKQVRFGWIDGDDWIGQKAVTGQQSRLSIDVETKKFLVLYSVLKESSKQGFLRFR